MRLTVCVLVLAVLATVSCSGKKKSKAYDGLYLEEKIERLQNILDGLSRQVMLQQFFVEEQTRTNGNSGIKNIRINRGGTENYYETGVTEWAYLAMHNHSNFDRTVGLGELNVVMNGVDFRTRHNDYKLRMPSTSSTDYNAMEDIPFTEVPPSVLDQPTVEDQVVEMQEYFKAFKTQNVTHRDYRPYFKPVLCYIEGGWTIPKDDSGKIDEPFQSDRHQIDADSWFDLTDKVRFASYTGSKSVSENYAFLPTMIYKVTDGLPEYAQWNYRILCHPLKNDLPTKNLVPIKNDLSYRVPNLKRFEDCIYRPSLRFHLNKEEGDHFSKGDSLLDNLMNEIPGKDNYPAYLLDDSQFMGMEDIHFDNHTLLNTGYYHRYFKTNEKGAMGLNSIHRSFSDAQLFVAQTNHSQIVPMPLHMCKHGRCADWNLRYTYALPLEIIYMSPLASWNPYDIHLQEKPEAVYANGRNGLLKPEKAYNGSTAKIYYQTPATFYAPKPGSKDPADTGGDNKGVLDKNGQMRTVAASGVRIVVPNIAGVGQVRLRYPIMPIHHEGSPTWMELNALKEMTMKQNRYASLFEEVPSGTRGVKPLHFQLRPSEIDGHTHDFHFTQEEFEDLKKNNYLTLRSLESDGHTDGHTHELLIRWAPWLGKIGKVQVQECDGLGHDGLVSCPDRHPTTTDRIDKADWYK